MDLVTSLVAAFIGGVYGAMWLGPIGFVGGVAAGFSLGILYPMHEEEEAAEEEPFEEGRRIPLVGRLR